MNPTLTARHLALTTLSLIFQQKISLDDAFKPPSTMEERDRAFAKMAVMTIIRRRGQLNALIETCLTRPLPSKPWQLRILLQLGIVQVLFMDVPDHAAVDSTVSMAKDLQFPPPLIGFVNALMRRMTREGRDLLQKFENPELNLPDWLWKNWVKTYGLASASKIAKSLLLEPPLDLTLRDKNFTHHFPNSIEIMPGTMRLPKTGSIQSLNGFSEGLWWVQDIAASLPVKMMGPLAGRTVADLCAAPGGKTAQLIAAQANVTAIDRSEARLGRLRDNLKRLSLTAEIIHADASKWMPVTLFDVILLDAPCSATGTLRRHPDVAWLKTSDDIEKLALSQKKLLNNSIKMLKKDGILIYCTCSLQAEEGEQQIDAFLKENPSLYRHKISPEEVEGYSDWITKEGDVRTLPYYLSDQGGMDGFFISRLRKK
jgi:16S rRNA (cytosine967-C5)-methyltransferase